VALATRNGIALRNYAETLHPYPAYNLGNRQTADQWYTRQLVSPWLLVLGKLRRYRGDAKRLCSLALWKQLTNLRIEPAIPPIEALNGSTSCVVYVAILPFAFVHDFE